MMTPKPKRRELHIYTKSHSQEISLFDQQQLDRRVVTIPFPSEEKLYKQISREIVLNSPLQKKQLKISINNQYKKHLSVIEAHQERLLRFMQGHGKSLQSIQQQTKIIKATIVLKQQKAMTNKRKQLLIKSKKVQQSLIRWKGRISTQKVERQQHLQKSARAIQNWEDKSESGRSRKSLILQEVSESMRDINDNKIYISSKHIRKLTENLSESNSLRKKTGNPYGNAFPVERGLNPKNQSVLSKADSQSLRDRYIRNGSRESSKSKRSGCIMIASKVRVSTESVMQRQRQMREAELQKSLFETVEKSKRINQARQIKLYLDEQRQSQIRQKRTQLSHIQKQHAQQERKKIEIRNQGLNRKHRQDRTRMRDISLPIIHGVKSIENSLEEKLSRNGTGYSGEIERNYNSEIIGKLRSMSIVMNKYLKR